ncbi:MAG: dihydrodipicolinate synthase family protein [Chitinophagaceae bacterium]
MNNFIIESMNEVKKKFIPVMITPFLETGEVDYDGLTAITELYIKSGAAGLFANCLSSEMFELSDSERLDIVAHVVKIANSSIPVMATGTFKGTILEQAEFVKRIYDQGTQAVIVNSNMLAAETESDMVFTERMYELLNLTENIPLGFYECPVEYKRLIPPRQLKEFVGTGRVIYHKDTCCNIGDVREKLKQTASINPQFGFYDAYLGHAVNSLRAGSSGLSCIQGNFWPELIVWLCENYNNSELLAEVDKVQQFLNRNMDIVHYVYPIIAKYYLQKRGIKITTVIRQKPGLFTTEVKQNIDNLFNECQLLQQEIQLSSTV